MSRLPGEPKLAIDRKDPQGNYYIYYTDGAGRSREKSTFTRDRREAELYKAEWLIGRERPKSDPDPDEVLIIDALNYYMVKKLPKATDPDRIRNAVKAMLPFWADRYISEITEDTCDEYVEWRDRANETVRRELGVLSTAVKRYADDGYVSKRVKVYKPDSEDGRIRWLEFHEALRLYRAARKSRKASGHLPFFILIGVLTGQRKEAILSLKWEDVDLVRGRIDWNPKGRKRSKKRRPKTTIPKRLTRYLKKRRISHPQDTHVVTYQGTVRSACR